MMNPVGGDGRAARVIRAQEVGRLNGFAAARANDNGPVGHARRPGERGGVALARAVLAAAGPTVSARAPFAARPLPARPDGPAAAAGPPWLAAPAALWTAGLDSACRLPPVASGLALWRAWSEVGLAGAATCASVAASGVELLGVTVAGLLGAALPRPGRAPSATDR